MHLNFVFRSSGRTTVRLAVAADTAVAAAGIAAADNPAAVADCSRPAGYTAVVADTAAAAASIAAADNPAAAADCNRPAADSCVNNRHCYCCSLS